MAFEKLVPSAGNCKPTDRVALSILVTKAGSAKARLVLGTEIAARLGLAPKSMATLEYDKFTSQLRVSKGGEWKCSKWSGGVLIGLLGASLNIPAVHHPIEKVKAAFDQEGRLVIALPLWAQPPKEKK
jgi:hypothetical protein